MDRVTRKDLKRDKFALEVQHGIEYVSGHRKPMIRYGLIGAVVVLLAVGFIWYRRHESNVRQQAVEAAREPTRGARFEAMPTTFMNGVTAASLELAAWATAYIETRNQSV